MTTKEYFSLANQDKEKICQQLSPYNEDEIILFREVEKKFSIEFGHNEGIEKIKCGLAPMLGPFNCILIFIPKGSQQVNVPDKFEGFPTMKIYESQYKTYRELIK